MSWRLILESTVHGHVSDIHEVETRKHGTKLWQLL